MIYNAIYNVMYNVIVIPSSTTFRFCGEKKKQTKNTIEESRERNFDW